MYTSVISIETRQVNESLVWYNAPASTGSMMKSGSVHLQRNLYAHTNTRAAAVETISRKSVRRLVLVRKARARRNLLLFSPALLRGVKGVSSLLIMKGPQPREPQATEAQPSRKLARVDC